MGATETVEVLITVLTYPHPSRGYNELVCTAGITKSLEWVRLYPIDYRYQPENQQFRKYQWIRVALDVKGAKNDSRKESRRPILESIELIGEPLSTRNHWAERREIIDRLPHATLRRNSAKTTTTIRPVWTGSLVHRARVGPLRRTVAALTLNGFR